MILTSKIISPKHLYTIAKSVLLVLVLAFVSAFSAISQNSILGNPQVKSHSKQSYSGGPQIWDIDYTSGHLLFANSGGLLTFDGKAWQFYTTPNQTIMRSVAVSNENKVFIGAQDEIGYFNYGINGDLSYISIKDSLPKEYRNLEEIWNVALTGDTLYFSSDTSLFQFANGQTTRFGQNSFIDNFSVIGSEVWYHCMDSGIYTIKDNLEIFIPDSEQFIGTTIVDMLRIGSDQTFIFTSDQGIFLHENNEFSKWDNNAQDYLIEKLIHSVCYDKHYGIFIGTRSGGLICINESGQTTLKLTKNNGLQNNRIISIALAPNGVLWLGTNNGIDEINISASFQHFYPDLNLEGAVYDMEKWNGSLFFSTSNGLYYIEESNYYNPLHEVHFTLIPGTKGQTWATNIIDNQLYCAHHEGALRISSSLETEIISEGNGSWQFVQLSKNIIAIGQYNGVSLFAKDDFGNLKLLNKVEGIHESSRIMVWDVHDNLWVSHPYKNVYRINFNADFTKSEIKTYDKRKGFVTDERNYVFDISGECYLTNETGVYKYSVQSDSFAIYQPLNKIFERGNHVRRLIQIDSSLWCITDDYTTRLYFNHNKMEDGIRSQEFINVKTEGNYIGGFEELFPYSDNSIIISCEEGAIEYNLNSSSSAKINVNIKSISLLAPIEKVIYSGFGMLNMEEFAYNENALRISYGNTLPNSNMPLNYSVRLIGLDDNWSSWTTNNFKEYSNLHFGKYNFELRASDNMGHKSNVVDLPFVINPPFYRTRLASVIYFLAILGFVLALIFIPKKRYNENTAILESEKRMAEEKVEIVKQEKLESELAFKNKELASSTLHLLQKNQTLNTLQNKITHLKSSVKNVEAKKELNKVLAILKSDLRMDDDWDKFSIYFDQVHNGFLTKLEKEFPDLSKNDYKLCAYLKMNLSTKEISPLMNISTRGVEIGRYRLRKKLNLERSINLNKYIIQLGED